MADKKRPKYITELITKVNEYLREENIKDSSNDLFSFLQYYLIKKDMYHGYNFYNRMTTDTGEEYICLSCSCCNYDFLQIY